MEWILGLKPWEDCRRVINNVLIPRWNLIPGLPDSFPSGVLLPDVMYWVRREAWNSEEVEQAKTSVRQAYTRLNLGNPHAWKFQWTEYMEDEVGEVATEKTFKDSWFPKPWLVFTYHGEGSPKTSRSAAVHTGTIQQKLQTLLRNSSMANRRLACELDTADEETDDELKKKKAAIQEVLMQGSSRRR